MSSFFEHPVFKDAIADIEALGVKVSEHPHPGAIAYAVIGGRSNARWWLLPLENRHVTCSGLALFQPILSSAQWMKRGVIVLSKMGLGRLWAKPKIYVSGRPAIAEYFNCDSLSFAYFTGTDSPHRKVAVQVMDRRGKLKGFAKLTRNANVRQLLLHEANTLKYVSNLGLQTAYVPKVLFAGDIGNVHMIVTDTLKTPRTKTKTHFAVEHRAFLQELAEKTTPKDPVSVEVIAKDFRTRFNRISPHLENVWCGRLEKAISALEGQSTLKLGAGLSHGDFTPWNTFMANGRLYVFDWEYAEESRPISNDIIHFVLNQPQTRSLPARAKIEAVMAGLAEPWMGLQKEAVPSLLVIYLLTQTLRQLERLPKTIKPSSTWDGADDAAGMFDRLLAYEIPTNL